MFVENITNKYKSNYQDLMILIFNQFNLRAWQEGEVNFISAVQNSNMIVSRILQREAPLVFRDWNSHYNGSDRSK